MTGVLNKDLGCSLKINEANVFVFCARITRSSLCKSYFIMHRIYYKKGRPGVAIKIIILF